jgi:Gas vesicle synthesis protein GvpO
MADVERKTPIRRRTHKSGETPSSDDDRHVEGGADRRPVPEESGTRIDQEDREPAVTAGEGGGTGAEGAPRCNLAVIARRAASLVATLSGRRPESVISIERKDDEWRVGVEVVEVSRIPDSADILAVYDVRLDTDGDLLSYRRVRRYARGHMDSERQR